MILYMSDMSPAAAAAVRTQFPMLGPSTGTADHSRYCRTSFHTGHVCTRPEGHIDPHVAHMDANNAIVLWTDVGHPLMSTPEGWY